MERLREKSTKYEKMPIGMLMRRITRVLHRLGKLKRRKRKRFKGINRDKASCPLAVWSICSFFLYSTLFQFLFLCIIFSTSLFSLHFINPLNRFVSLHLSHLIYTLSIGDFTSLNLFGIIFLFSILHSSKIAKKKLQTTRMSIKIRERHRNKHDQVHLVQTLFFDWKKTMRN